MYKPGMLIKHQVPVLGLIFLVWFFWLVACEQPADINRSDTTQHSWELAQPADVGIDEDLLSELVDQISKGEYQNLHSILIVKDGRLIFEKHFPGYEWDWDADQFQGEFKEFDAETLHVTMSVSKVFASLLAGIALEQGFIEDLDQTLLTYFPEYAHISDPQVDEITLRHLLTTKTGLEWNGIEIPVSTRDPRNDVLRMNSATDPVAYVLSKPLIAEPGTQWYYSNGDVVLLGEVIRESSGLTLEQFAEQYLFAPLGITGFRWRRLGETDVLAAGGGLELRPRDMAKLGLLYLNDGDWNGDQVISADWVEESVSHQADVLFGWLADLFGEGYGYYWWLDSMQTDQGEYAAYTSTGWGGQRISLFPSLDMAVVMTGGNYLSADPGREILEKYILPAVE